MKIEKEENKKEKESNEEDAIKDDGGKTIKETAKTVLDFFKKPFNGIGEEDDIFKKKFGARDYIETYYPAIEDVSASLEVFEEIQFEIKNNNNRLDVRRIMREKGLRCEEIENMFIFDFQRYVSKELLKAFPEDHIKTLDVGGGPTVYQHIFNSMVAGDIIHSEFLEQNREEIVNWVNESGEEYNWDSYFELIKNIIKNDKEYLEIIKNNLNSEDKNIKEHTIKINSFLGEGGKEKIKKNLQNVIGDKIIFADVFRGDLGIEDGGDAYEFVNSSSRESAIELVTSNFTVESATEERDKWQEGMKNIMSKVKNGGYLAISAIRNASWYKVGEEKMPAVEINEEDLEKIFKKNGFKILNQRVLEGSNKEEDGYDGMVFVFAQKV